MSCEDGICPLEQVQLDNRSVGPVEDDELLYRGAFDPLHYLKNGQVRPAFIRESDIVAGTLSVWRVSRQSGLNTTTALPLITAPAGNTLRAVFAAKVGDVRATKIFGVEGRSFCVIDETNTDTKGNFHPAHAHISPCRSELLPLSQDAPEKADELRLMLRLLFTSSPVWP
jgi:hypothetical protein